MASLTSLLYLPLPDASALAWLALNGNLMVAYSPGFSPWSAPMPTCPVGSSALTAVW